jgi:hypothetical protein
MKTGKMIFPIFPREIGKLKINKKSINRKLSIVFPRNQKSQYENNEIVFPLFSREIGKLAPYEFVYFYCVSPLAIKFLFDSKYCYPAAKYAL